MKCIECGYCKVDCPVHMALLNESASARTKGRLLNLGMTDKIFYLCTNCGACEKSCPVEVDFKIVDMRAKLVQDGKGLQKDKEMVENMKKYGNPFGINPKGLKKEMSSEEDASEQMPE